MRTLKFIVDNQIIKQDPNCDFNNLIPGTEGYLRAEFSFSPEWNGFTKTAMFSSMLGTKYPSQELKDGKTCTIPIEALKRRSFKVWIVGSKGSNTKLKTTKIEINQNGGDL